MPDRLRPNTAAIDARRWLLGLLAALSVLAALLAALSSARAAPIVVPPATYEQTVSGYRLTCYGCPDSPSDTASSSQPGAFNATVYGNNGPAPSIGHSLIRRASTNPLLPAPTLSAGATSAYVADPFYVAYTSDAAQMTYYFQVIGPASVAVPVIMSASWSGAAKHVPGWELDNPLPTGMSGSVYVEPNSAGSGDGNLLMTCNAVIGAGYTCAGSQPNFPVTVQSSTSGNRKAQPRCR